MALATYSCKVFLSFMEFVPLVYFYITRSGTPLLKKGTSLVPLQRSSIKDTSALLHSPTP